MIIDVDLHSPFRTEHSDHECESPLSIPHLIPMVSWHQVQIQYILVKQFQLDMDEQLQVQMDDQL